MTSSYFTVNDVNVISKVADKNNVTASVAGSEKAVGVIMAALVHDGKEEAPWW